MRLIDLCLLMEYDEYFGILLPCSSNVEWTNQTGGAYCAHPKVEGIYVPLPLGWLPTPDPLQDRWGPYNDYLISTFLEASTELLKHFEPLSQLLPVEDCGEAWVPVKVVSTDPLLNSFNREAGILTYLNSD